jgi:hypothetical protein
MGTEAEYCRWQAERMRALAKQCSERNIRGFVSGTRGGGQLQQHVATIGYNVPPKVRLGVGGEGI